MTINNKIKELRKINNLTQEDLAEKINVSRQTISKWENGSSLPDAENIVSLCKIFNVSSDYLLTQNTNLENKKTIKILNLLLLIFGMMGFIIFGILLLNNKINQDSSTININGYGIFCILFFILIITSVIILFKNEKK